MNKKKKFIESLDVSNNLDTLVTSYLFSLHETFQQTRQNRHLSHINGASIYEVSTKSNTVSGNLDQLIIKHKIPEIKYERIHYFITKKPVSGTFYILEDVREQRIKLLSKFEYVNAAFLKSS